MHTHAEALRCIDCGLQKLCFPPSFSAQALDQLGSIIGQAPAVPKGGIIYRAGEAMQAIFAVRSGAVKTSLAQVDGREQITGFYLPGEVVGLENLGQATCAGTATALEKTTLCALPVNAVSALSRQLPELQRHLFQIMSTEIRADYQRMHLIGQTHAEERIASFLIGLSVRQQQRRLTPDTLRLPMSRADLGNHLGLALETVSRSLGRLQQQGIVEVSGKMISITDRPGLMALVKPQCT